MEFYVTVKINGPCLHIWIMNNSEKQNVNSKKKLTEEYTEDAFINFKINKTKYRLFRDTCIGGKTIV